ncbi:unnamed protein product [Effrenium voratum]|uniref:Uncharacterized protein n=1 Tax=Effrenium voratum TaxID=2562239 RepID=A0AA36JL79_9DINO|nr:unnamed protein product [Effrenium voratum]
MNKVISGYFDSAHRGLQRQQQGEKISGSGSQVQLPPLRNEEVSEFSKEGHSKSFGSLVELTSEQARVGIQSDKYQQVLQDNAKLMKKLRDIQAQRLEKEFKKGRDQSEALQKDLLEARREASQLSRESQEAMQMMTEMRKAHIQEVRLLQRGLAARGNGEMRNKVNEVADLVDKLGRAVLQRDENLREKSKAQVRLGKVEGDLRAITEECTRLKRQNKSLNDQLKEAQRKARFTPPRVDGAPEDSDEEFEHELLAFEQRFTILEEGPAGLDILASNLSKDKQGLEKRLKQSQETVGSLTSSVAEWKRLSEEQDLQIADLNTKLDQMMRDHAAMQEAIAQKRREIEQQVAEEKAQLEAKVVELQLECDNARAVSDGMDKASNRVQKELTKAQDAFTAAQQKRAEAHGAPAETEPDPSGAGGGAPAAAPEAAAGEAPSAEPGSAEPGSAEPGSAEPGSAEGAQPQPAEPATTGAPTEPAASAPEEAPGEVLGEGRGNEGGAG